MEQKTKVIEDIKKKVIETYSIISNKISEYYRENSIINENETLNLKKQLKTLFFKNLSNSVHLKKIIIDNDEELLINNKNEYIISICSIDSIKNLLVNSNFGSVFCVIHYNKKENEIINGKNIILAGYSIYGIMNNLILAEKNNVSIYNYHFTKNEYHLIEDNVKAPNSGNNYFADESNKQHWSEYNIHQLLDKIRDKKELKYTNSIVTDTHHILKSGGIYICPIDNYNPSGKLYLFNMAYPIAFIIESAGGKTSNLKTSILELPYSSIKKTPIIFGSSEEMEILNDILNPALLFFD